jgi:glycosyltransferase involved in cell wall biosynthesis
MKIALVSKAIYPVRGGVELHVHNLACELTQLGHQVHAFTSSKAAGTFPSVDYQVSAGMKVPALYAALRRGGFEVLHAHGARSAIACGALVAGKLLGMRTLFTPHCFYPPQDWRGRLKRGLFDPTLGKLALCQADRIICLTENDRHDAIQCGAPAERIRIIPNSIRLPAIPDDGLHDHSRLDDFRERYRVNTFLLSVGRLDRVKHGDLIISALPQLPSHLQLMFIGPDAGCRRQWNAHAEQLGVAARVRFVSEVPDEDLLLAYRASAAVVMASFYEGLPTVLLEGMALGTPVIAADTGGIRYLIQHGVNGLLYRYDDLAGLCANLRRCLETEPQIMAMKANACELVRKHYSWARNAARVAALYDGTEN